MRWRRWFRGLVWKLWCVRTMPRQARDGNLLGMSIMLRVYFVQQWFNLSDPGVEEALYESAALRRFVGVDLGVAPAPDETTVLRRSESQGDRCLRSPAAFLRHDALRGAYDLSGCSRRDNREGVERQRYRVS